MAKAKPDIRVRRVYEAPERADGARFLVDRLWPRGIRKESAALDGWLKEIAPSAELRKWFHAGGHQFSEFEKAYRKELTGMDEEFAPLLRAIAEQKAVTLLYALKDEEQNHAMILRDVLVKRLGKGATR